MDKSNDESVLQVVQHLNSQFPFSNSIKVSALEHFGIDNLINTIKKKLLPGPPFYPKDELSEHPTRFFVSELIREQLFLQ